MSDYLHKKGIWVYPQSVREDVCIARTDAGDDVLVIEGKLRSLDHDAAVFLRERFSFTAPVSVLARPCTIGVGDRLGIAGPGHLRVFAAYEATPVLAQQSMRELTLTGRTYDDVLDCATFAVFREGYTDGFGADGDHLKRAEDVAHVLALGYSMVTLDCSDHIHPEFGEKTLSAEARARYLDGDFPIGDGITLKFDERALARIAYTYDDAIDFAADIWQSYFAQGAQADFEMSIDETGTPTTPLEHLYVAEELRRRGVKAASIAPRFCGAFEKGIDYIGDVDQFDRELVAHAALARRYGYKLSIHSGSDKFRVFPSIGRHTRGRVHVKTAGTNWLEALRVAAALNPALYRAVHNCALESFDQATAYYHVSADLGRLPPLVSLADDALPALLDDPDARQLLHITYGPILGRAELRDRLYAFWQTNAQAYAEGLEGHIGRHLQELGVKKREP